MLILLNSRTLSNEIDLSLGGNRALPTGSQAVMWMSPQWSSKVEMACQVGLCRVLDFHIPGGAS